jgi:hypothetical protein
MRVLHQTAVSAATPATVMNRTCRRLAITDIAALRIFRDCFWDYTALLEECPVDLTPPQVMHFLIDFERILQRALGPLSLEQIARIRTGDVSLTQKAIIGRHLASSGLWPVESYFARP